MKKIVKRLVKHPLIYGSSIVLIGTLAANFINFLFNLYMIRSLSNAEYGIYASAISILGFPSLISGAIIPLVVQFAGTYFAKGQLGFVKGLYVLIMKFFFVVCMVFFVIFLLAIPQISDFLHIKNDLILVLTNIIILVSILSIVNTAFLQAKLAFVFQVVITLIVSVTKFFFGFIFIFLGFSVNGAISATLISGVIAYFVSFFPLRFLFFEKAASANLQTKELFTYGIPSTFTLIGLTSLISADILLVKHFFDPVQAGIYAGLSLVGRIIFYLSAPITSVMFPVIVQKYTKNEKVYGTLALALLIVMIPSFLLTVIYFMFPEQIILFFTKKAENTIVSPYLGLFGIFVSFYCGVYMLANFYLSIKKTKVYIPVLIGGLLQLILILFFHQSFLHIVVISTVVTFFILLALVSYLPYAIRR